MSAVTQHAPMAGVVVAHLVEVGNRVDTGDAIVVTETMKCESVIRAEQPGTITWLAPIGTEVAGGCGVARFRTVDPVRPPTPEELIGLLTGTVEEPRLSSLVDRAGFTELDLDPGEPTRLVEVSDDRCDRDAGVVVGVLSHLLHPHDQPVRRVWICGDATRSLGAVAEPECRRIIAAIDLAEELGTPLEWVAVSSGARISLESGTENMDWCAAVVRRLVEFTQGGGEVVIVVAGMNVGAQSYWNAEATMLMHCAGMLVMVEGSAMVLTGHRALASAGGQSEGSNHDLGGTPVMVPNGQAHHHVTDLTEALRLVLVHHGLCARNPAVPRVRAASTDPADRDVCRDPYDDPTEVSPGHRHATRVGHILEAETNPERTRAFAIEPVMASLSDRDAPRLRRWEGLRGGSGAHVWDTRIDGWPVSLIGIDSRPRRTDGDWEAAATLYPMAAQKIARALNHASGRRPAVVLANLAGFDGSRASLEDRQLEYGGELARSVVNFRGPLVVVVIGRFHGGAYVVLNRRLNPELTLVALEGTRVSVIGGSAAAGVVLRREVGAELEGMGASAEDTEAHRSAVRTVAQRFDSIHDVDRAAAVGSIDRVITPAGLRPTVAELISDPGRTPRLTPRCPEPRLGDMTATPV